jgi:arylsulfatase A-like enzyme
LRGVGLKNLILIVMDALRFDHVTSEITPNLMRIAREGVFFRYCLAGGGTTKSSIPCIISSNYTYDPEENLPMVLKGAGYITGCLHSNLLLNDFQHGFDTFVDLKRKVLSQRTKMRLRKILGDRGIRAIKTIRRKVKPAESYIPYVRAERLMRRCLRWMSEAGKPFFLWVHFMEPHVPYFPPENDLGLSTRELMELNDKLVEAAYKKMTLSEDEIKIIKKLYRLEVSYMDHWIGEFYGEVRDGENIIVFTSDHGDELGDHGGFSHGGRVLPELYHVPLIIVGEGIKRGVVVEEDVSHLDLAPTLLDLLGLYEHRFGLGRSLRHLCVE